jgi:CheY-like chemotaxis protein
MYKAKISDPTQRYNDSIKKLNILIVDDDENSRESLRDMIKNRGHNVTTLDEGMKCVNRCSENKFDMIFMDYHINDIDGDVGELDGTDVTRMVRECFNINSVVYAYTGDNTSKAVKEFKINNMKGAFIKPVEPSLIAEFLKIVEKNIDDQIKLQKLAIKRKNFMYFGTKCKSIKNIEERKINN